MSIIDKVFLNFQVFSLITIITTLVFGLAVGIAINDKNFQEQIKADPKFAEIAGSEATAVISAVAIVFVIILILFLAFNIVFLVGVHKVPQFNGFLHWLFSNSIYKARPTWAELVQLHY